MSCLDDNMGKDWRDAGRMTIDDIRRLYRQLKRVRRVEEEVARLYPSDVIKSPVHLSIGQEAASVGVCDVLERRDAVGATYRGHAAYLAKGGDLKALMAELFGKATGACHGKGGSMHIIDMNVTVLGTSAVVGTTIPIAAGFAWAFKQDGDRRVVATFFGDGATEEGVFHETLNFASLHKLPILFVCENNFYAIHEPLAKRWASPALCARVEQYGIPATRIDDGDIRRIRSAASDAVAAMRDGKGPAFLEVCAYRWREHVGPAEDFAAGYRPSDEARPWQARDPVELLGAELDPALRAAIDDEIAGEIAEAIEFAESSPFPERAALYRDVYAD